MAHLGFLPALSADDNDDVPGMLSDSNDSDDETDKKAENAKQRRMRMKKRKRGAADEFDPNFDFADDGDLTGNYDPWQHLKELAKKGTKTSLDDMIAKARRKRKAGEVKMETETVS